MLTSLLKIEEFLKCEVCQSTLRQTRALSDCGHRFCMVCVTPYIEENGKCPTCELETDLDSLQRNLVHDNLVAYVTQLKQALLAHSLTPLEESLRKRQQEDTDMPLDNSTDDDFVTPQKRVADVNTQESENYEDEYSDIPVRKKFKPSSSVNEGAGGSEDEEEEEDHMAVLDDLLSFTKRPSRKAKEQHGKYTVDPLENLEDEEMEEVVTTPRVLQRVGSPQTPEESPTTNQTWKCKCEYENASYMQVCGLCKHPKNETAPSPNQLGTKSQRDKQKGKAKASTSAAESSSSRRSQSTMADRSLEGATVAPVKRTRRTSSPIMTLPSRRKSVNIMYTMLTKADDMKVEKSVERVVQSTLHFQKKEEMKEFSEVTHVITSVDKKNQCHRTLKYLHGILTGKWIVNPQWLFESFEQKKWLPEENYEVKGDAKCGLTHAPERGRERLANKEPLLFTDMQFHFAGEYSELYNKKDLSALAVAGGATVLTKRPSATGGESSRNKKLDLEKPIIIYSQGSKKKREAWLKDYQVRDVAWLIECIGKLTVE